jgi:DNA invertase Pin-like site-specific DNA recombinase
LRRREAYRIQRSNLRIPAINLDTGTPTGKLILNVFGQLAQFERKIMLERQRKGVAKAKGDGKYKGRAPTARAKADGIRRLAAAGATRESIATQLGVSVRSVYRVLGWQSSAIERRRLFYGAA